MFYPFTSTDDDRKQEVSASLRQSSPYKKVLTKVDTGIVKPEVKEMRS